MQNKQWILNSFPVGEIKDNDLIFKDSNLNGINDGEVLIKNIYLSLDPANRGWMSGKASYVDAMQIGDIMRGGTIGIVEESKNEKFKTGDAVQYQGGWQEYCINDGKGLRVIPLNTGLELPSFLSVMGMPGMTAYFGLLDVLKPKENETIVVSGAAGAVGSLVSQIAKIKGCRVIGIAGTEEKCSWLKNDLNVDGVINYKTDNLNSTLKELCPDGIDMYFDNVGGEITEAVINRFNIGGRMSICGQISGYNSETLQPGPRNWINILVKRLKVQGFIVFDYQARAKEAFVDMSKWMAEGKLQHKNHIVDGLENAVSSLKMLFSGENKGKMIVKISEEPNL
jgi:NADPH-dependent curcumin reductase CurA